MLQTLQQTVTKRLSAEARAACPSSQRCPYYTVTSSRMQESAFGSDKRDGHRTFNLSKGVLGWNLIIARQEPLLNQDGKEHWLVYSSAIYF